MELPTSNQRPKATIARRMIAAIAALAAAGIDKESAIYARTHAQFAGRHGKHNGRTKGAFGRCHNRPAAS